MLCLYHCSSIDTCGTVSTFVFLSYILTIGDMDVYACPNLSYCLVTISILFYYCVHLCSKKHK